MPHCRTKVSQHLIYFQSPLVKSRTYITSWIIYFIHLFSNIQSQLRIFCGVIFNDTYHATNIIVLIFCKDNITAFFIGIHPMKKFLISCQNVIFFPVFFNKLHNGWYIIHTCLSSNDVIFNMSFLHSLLLILL